MDGIFGGPGLLLLLTVFSFTSSATVLRVKRENDLPILSMRLQDTIPGEPHEDYPVFDEVPDTSFRCSSQAFAGYYADVEARCQVFHICQFSGRQDSFLCPNGSVFDQRYFVCNWWFNVDCTDARSFYSLNSHLFLTSDRSFKPEDGVQRGSEGFNVDDPLPLPSVIGGGSVIPSSYNYDYPHDYRPSQSLRETPLHFRAPADDEGLFLEPNWQETADNSERVTSHQPPYDGSVVWSSTVTHDNPTNPDYPPMSETPVESFDFRKGPLRRPNIGGYPVEDDYSDHIPEEEVYPEPSSPPPRPQVPDPFISEEPRFPITTYKPSLTFFSSSHTSSSRPSSDLRVPTASDLYNGASPFPSQYVSNAPLPEPIIKIRRPVPLAPDDQTFISNQQLAYKQKPPSASASTPQYPAEEPALQEPIINDQPKKQVGGIDDYDDGDSYSSYTEPNAEPSPITQEAVYGQRLVPVTTSFPSVDVSSYRPNTPQSTGDLSYPVEEDFLVDEYKEPVSSPRPAVLPFENPRPVISFESPSTATPQPPHQTSNYPTNVPPIEEPIVVSQYIPLSQTQQPFDYPRTVVPVTSPAPERINIMSNPNPPNHQQYTEYSNVSVEALPLSTYQPLQENSDSEPPVYNYGDKTVPQQSPRPLPDDQSNLLYDYPNGVTTGTTQPPIKLSSSPNSYPSEDIEEQLSVTLTNFQPITKSPEIFRQPIEQNTPQTNTLNDNSVIFSRPNPMSIPRPSLIFPPSESPQIYTSSPAPSSPPSPLPPRVTSTFPIAQPYPNYPTNYSPINELSPTTATVVKNPSSNLIINNPPAYPAEDGSESPEFSYQPSPSVANAPEELEILEVEQPYGTRKPPHIQQPVTQAALRPVPSVTVRPVYGATSDPSDGDLEEIHVSPVPQEFSVQTQDFGRENMNIGFIENQQQQQQQQQQNPHVNDVNSQTQNLLPEEIEVFTIGPINSNNQQHQHPLINQLHHLRPHEVQHLQQQRHKLQQLQQQQRQQQIRLQQQQQQQQQQRQNQFLQQPNHLQQQQQNQNQLQQHPNRNQMHQQQQNQNQLLQQQQQNQNQLLQQQQNQNQLLQQQQSQNQLHQQQQNQNHLHQQNQLHQQQQNQNHLHQQQQNQNHLHQQQQNQNQLHQQQQNQNHLHQQQQNQNHLHQQQQNQNQLHQQQQEYQNQYLQQQKLLQQQENQKQHKQVDQQQNFQQSQQQNHFGQQQNQFPQQNQVVRQPFLLRNTQSVAMLTNLASPNAPTISLPLISSVPYAGKTKATAVNGNTILSPQHLISLSTIPLKRVHRFPNSSVQQFKVNTSGNKPLVIRLSEDVNLPPKIEVSSRRIDHSRRRKTNKKNLSSKKE